MPYDNYLIGGVLIAALALLRFLRALWEGRRPWIPVALFILGAVFLYWAWELSGQSLKITDIPEAIIRIIGRFI